MPEPATRSLTVWETRTSPADAAADTRAPTFTARPASLSPTRSHSPVWIPARTSRPSSGTRSTISRAHEIARAGPSKLAKNPSPAVSISMPRYRASSIRTSSWCRSSRLPPVAVAELRGTLGRIHEIGEEDGRQHGVRNPARRAPLEERLHGLDCELILLDRSADPRDDDELGTRDTACNPFRIRAFPLLPDTSVRTRIAGRASLTSRSICMRLKSAHEEGLEVSL